VKLLTWDRAADLMLPKLNDCPWPVAKLALIEAAREFYRRSMAWRYDLDPIISAAGVRDYPLVFFKDAEIVKVNVVRFDGDVLDPLSQDQWGKRIAELNQGRGAPTEFTAIDSVLWLHPIPATNGNEIRVNAAFRPALSAVGLYEPQWNAHIEHIIQGAVSKLAATQHKPYTDAKLEGTAGAHFELEIQRAYHAAEKNQTRARTPNRSRYY
jgi:hypothetical protein